MPSIQVRPAAPADVPALMALIRELAAYERLLDQVVATEDGMRLALFGPQPAAEAVVAELDAALVGYAVFFPTFSTFVGRPSLYLEDLYVRPEARRRGVGRALLLHVARLAVARGCGRFEWTALNWNVPAVSFYRSLGAVPLADWTAFRLEGEALARAGR